MFNVTLALHLHCQLYQVQFEIVKITGQLISNCDFVIGDCQSFQLKK